MSTLYGHIFLSGLLFHLLPVALPARIVYGYIGHSVTLPCKYDARYYGTLHMCWGKGYIPNRGCNNEILSTNGKAVTYRKLHRYTLLGRLMAGDVSLTIRYTVGSDAGIYGCRVEIPGWFNDQKETVHLILRAAPTTTTQAPVITERETESTTTAATTTTQELTTERETTNIPTTVPVMTTKGLPSSPLPSAKETSTTLITQSIASVMTTDAPVPSYWPTDPETTGMLRTDTYTQVPVMTTEGLPSSSHPTAKETSTTLIRQIMTTDAPVPSYWPTDPETTGMLRTDTYTQGDWASSTTSPSFGQTSDNSTSSAEKALVVSPPLLWIFGSALLLAVVLSGIVFLIRQRHKAGSFKIPQQTGSSALLTTSDPILELDTRKMEMKDVVQLKEGENAERCP